MATQNHDREEEVERKPLRVAGRSEKRCIIRQHLGFYQHVIVTARYSSLAGDSEALSLEAISNALRKCISEHPVLSAEVEEEDTESPGFVRVEKLRLEERIHFAETVRFGMGEEGDRKEEEGVEGYLKRLHNVPTRNRPLWELHVLPVERTNSDGTTTERYCYIAFTFSHALGDGKSGPVFHKSLITALRNPDTLTETTSTDLLPPLEQAVRLSISRIKLLSIVLAEILPRSITQYFGIQGLVPYSPDLWNGVPHFAPSPTEGLESEIILSKISSEILNSVLKECREHETKFTGLLHQAVVYALHKTLVESSGRFDFVGVTPINLRPLLPAPFSEDSIGVLTSGDFALFSPAKEYFDANSKLVESIWEASRKTTSRLQALSKTLQDQPVGLYAYISSFRAWLENHIGKPREASYEITNLGSFDPSTAGSGERDNEGWNISRIVFSQPADVVGTPFSCNVVSLKGGEGILTYSWQRGALGVEVDGEVGFMRKVAGKVEEFLEKAALGGRE